MAVEHREGRVEHVAGPGHVFAADRPPDYSKRQPNHLSVGVDAPAAPPGARSWPSASERPSLPASGSPPWLAVSLLAVGCLVAISLLDVRHAARERGRLVG
jgi:hypothetical protein